MTSGASAPPPEPAAAPVPSGSVPRLTAAVVPLVPVWRVDRTFDYAVPGKLVGSIAVGSLVRVPFGSRRVRGIVVSLAETPPDDDLQEIAGAIVPEPLLGPEGPELFEWLARRYAAPRGLAYARLVPPRVRVARAAPAPISAPPPYERITAYTGARALVGAIEGGGTGAWCVRVLPGEDRGVLIAELVGAASRAGGAALVSVPEVAHGSIVLAQLERAYPGLERVDSARTEAERSRAWFRLAAGHGLGAGGRAGVLAPAPGLRLIVVDDEHHPTYKEDRAPRYDARRVALERARIQGAVCALVSSTPSLESGAAAADGRFGVVEPTRQDARAARPIVEVVDRPRDGGLSAQLHERVHATLDAGGRVALLAPRRGFARTVWCSACKRSLRCPRCESGVGLDRPAEAPRGSDAVTGGRLRCDRCGLVAPAPGACPSCGAEELRHLGAGSERVASQVARSFPRARVTRVDPDTFGGAGDPAPPGDIYVTTWIGTKEILRPPVSLVGVLDADSLTRRPDFRAAEVAYQVLSEMAEWAGPAAGGGRLVVQSSEPGHHALQAVVRADYRFFLERELPQREELGYPPFAELIKVVASGAAANDLIKRVLEVASAHRAAALGPLETRAQGDVAGALEVMLKCRTAEVVAADLRVILAAVPGGSRLRVDVDPR